MNKARISWMLRILISALFIVSAVAKLYPSPYFAISTFEVKQLYPLGFSEAIAPYFSRILIGIEFFLGIAILSKHYLKKITIPATLVLLMVFVVHLSYTTFVTGNGGNCGCFGELIPMTPVEAIIKNLIAIGILVLLYTEVPGDEKSNIWFLNSLLLASILALFMLAPMKSTTNSFPNSIEISVENDSLSLLPASTDFTAVTEPKDATELKNNKPTEEVAIADAPKPTKSGFASFFPTIDQDKKILCFFAPGCDHCQETAKQLTEMRKKDKSFPNISIIFMDEEVDKIPEFFSIAGSKYPYQVVDVINFWNLLGNTKDTPGVKYLWNGTEIKLYDGINENKFNAAALQKLLSKKYTDVNK